MMDVQQQRLMREAWWKGAGAGTAGSLFVAAVVWATQGWAFAGLAIGFGLYAIGEEFHKAWQEEETRRANERLSNLPVVNDRPEGPAPSLFRELD